MHFYAWEKGLKTGMYYLRTRPAASAIKFTVEKQYDTIPQMAEAITATATVITTSVTEISDNTIINNDVTTSFLDEVQGAGDQISCSLDNPEGCEMCGS